MEAERKLVDGGAAAVVEGLRRLRRRARARLVLQRAMLIAGAALVALVAIGLVDYVVRMPALMRGALTAGVLACVVVGVVRWLIPALRFRPSLTDIALRVERLHPEVAGLLASAVDFSTGWGAGAPASERALALRAVGQAMSKYSPALMRDVLRSRHAVEGGVWAGAGVLAVVAPAVVAPALWLIGAERVVAPWTGAAWPKRWGVVSATEVAVQPRGEAAPLRAVVVRSPVGAGSADVAVEWRAIDGDGDQAGVVRRELLTWQERDETAAGGERGALFERLIDPAGSVVRYRFIAGDDSTGWMSMRIVDRPRIESASAVVAPPAYVGGMDGGAVAAHDLGPGDDERAVAPVSLAGSAVKLEVAFSKPVRIDPPLEEVLAAQGAVDVRVDGSGADGLVERVVAEFRVESGVRVDVGFADSDGFGPAQEAVYRFDSVSDGEPSVVVLDPAQDVSVLASAVVPVVGQGRDDVGLESVSLERRVMTPAGAEGEQSGPGGAMEQRGVVEVVAVHDAARSGEASVSAEVALAALGVEAGDEVEVVAVAADVFRDAAGAPRGAARSSARVLRVIERSEFVDEVWRELAEVRDGAIRAEGEQQAARERVESGEAEPEPGRVQAQVSTRISRQAEAIAKVRERIAENRLGDAALDARLAEAERAAERAGQASSRASEAIERAGVEGEREESGTAPMTEEERGEVAAAQREVEGELARLASTLDTGEDTWAVRNAIEGLRERQQALRERTAGAARETAGQSLEELTAEQRTELERIVSEQQSLAQEMRELAEEMAQREQELAGSDAASSAAVRDARETAEQSGVQREMEQAAREAQENRTTQAGQSQERAVESLEQMLENLDESVERRAEVLRRLLKDVMESIRELVAAQGRELDALGAAEGRGEFAGLDAAMIVLHTSTLSVSDRAMASGPELAAVASLVGKAADAQSAAVVGLRKAPVDAEGARVQESRSLELLEQALSEAEQVDAEIGEREKERVLRELVRAYGDLLGRQTALRDATRPFADIGDLDRRERSQVRELGEVQREISESLAEVLGETEGLADALVFEYAHERLAAVTGGARDRLGDGDASGALPLEETGVAILQGLVTALEQEKEESPFDAQQGSQAQGGGGEGGPQVAGEEPLIPPIAQLKLLRDLQADLARRTASSGGGGRDIDPLGVEQGELHELGTSILEELVRQSGGGGGMPGDAGAPGGEVIEPVPPRDGAENGGVGGDGRAGS